jgi:endonuclease I
MFRIKKLLTFLLLFLVIGVVSGCSVSTTTYTTTNSTTANSTTQQTTTEVSTSTTSTETTTLPTTIPPTTFGYTGIEITELTKDEYAYNEQFDENSITVVLLTSSGDNITLRKGMFSISGFDSNTPGENLVTVTYGDFSTTFTVTILENTNSLVLSEYYKNAEGLTGNALLLALRTIINTGKVNISYDDARYILDETDRDPDNPDNVILIYTRASVPGEWNYPTWNREHVWPQSLLGNDSVMTSDLQNLKPSDVDENGFRGNKYFDNVSSTVAYEPPDEVKGDIARILFYMVVMYDKLALVNQAPTTYQMAMFSVLLSWHEADPVDDFERNRNDVIFQYQKNRNPFIDYPEFVELIWG